MANTTHIPNEWLREQTSLEKARSEFKEQCVPEPLAGGIPARCCRSVSATDAG